MKLATALCLFACTALWRWAGNETAGRFVVENLDNSDLSLRMLAGTLLVRAGRHSEPLLRQTLQSRRYLPAVLLILGDIGARGFEADLRRFSRDDEPEVAQAARDALRVLQSE